GWGLRKHEGSPARGLVVFAACELPEAALYLLLYETASGRRAYTDGALVAADGRPDPVVAAEHDLRFADGLLREGRIDLVLASAGRRRLHLEVRNRLRLSHVRYPREGLAPRLAPPHPAP